MKRLIGISLAFVFILGIVFVSQAVSTNDPFSAQAQTSTVKRKSRKVARRTYRGGKWVAVKTKNGTKMVYRKSKGGTKTVYRKSKKGTKKVYRKTKRVVT